MTQMDLTDISRTFHPDTKEYTFFSAPYGMFTKMTTNSVTKQTSTDTKTWNNPPCILSDHHGLKLEFNNNTQNNAQALVCVPARIMGYTEWTEETSL